MTVKVLACFAVVLSNFLVEAKTFNIPLWRGRQVPFLDSAQTCPCLDVNIPKENTNGVLLVVAPGGSYMKWCEWEGKCTGYFNAKGMATALLRYRTPRPEGRPKYLSAWQDAHSPMGSVRLYHKLRTMGIPAELHVFSGRKHADLPRGTWHELVSTWIERTVK